MNAVKAIRSDETLSLTMSNTLNVVVEWGVDTFAMKESGADDGVVVVEWGRGENVVRGAIAGQAMVCGRTSVGGMDRRGAVERLWFVC